MIIYVQRRLLWVAMELKSQRSCTNPKSLNHLDTNTQVKVILITVV